MEIELRAPRGGLVERLPAAVAFQLERVSWPSTAKDLRRRAEAALHDLEPWLDGVIAKLIGARIARLLPIWRRAQAAQRDRAAETRRGLEQAARQLVQAGLFDRRAMQSTRELLTPDADGNEEPAAGWSDDRASGEPPATAAEIAGRYQVGGIWLGELG